MKITFLFIFLFQPSDSEIYQKIIDASLYFKSINEILLMDDIDKKSAELAIIGSDNLAMNLYNSKYKFQENKMIESLQVVDFRNYFKNIFSNPNLKILALNEAHHVSSHRIFARYLLPYLKINGFTHIAIEALSQYDNNLNKRGYCQYLHTGNYTRDPEFANFIRDALEQGFQLIGYDTFQGDREILGATKICDDFTKDQGVKLFIYAGFDHIHKTNYLRDGSLIDFLSVYLETNPVCISQTNFISVPYKHDPDVCSPFYVYLNNDNKPYRGINNTVDYVINFNRRMLEKQNLNKIIPRLRNIRIESKIRNLELTYPIQVMAYVSKEGVLGVPVDIVSIKNRNSVINSFLCLDSKREYEIKVFDSAKKSLKYSYKLKL